LNITGRFPTPGSQMSLRAAVLTNYLNAVPLPYEKQATAFSWTSQTSAGTEAYAYFNATQMVWADIPTGDVAYSLTEWPSIILDAMTFRIHSTCPTTFATRNALSGAYFSLTFCDV
jgi:hypothetical protein